MNFWLGMGYLITMFQRFLTTHRLCLAPRFGLLSDPHVGWGGRWVNLGRLCTGFGVCCNLGHLKVLVTVLGSGPRTAPCPCPKGRVVFFSSCPRRHGSRLRQCVFTIDIASCTRTSAPWQAPWSPALPPDFFMNTKWVSRRKNRQVLLLCGSLRGPIMSHCPTLSFSIFLKLQLISSCLPTWWLSPLSTMLCIGGPVSTWKVCFFLEFRQLVILQRQLSDGFQKST